MIRSPSFSAYIREKSQGDAVNHRKGGSLSNHETEQWFALHVRSNHERLVQVSLQTKGYSQFLPLYHERNRRSAPIERVELPLFPGYVFARFLVHRRLPILTIPGVVRIVGFGRNPEPIVESELDAIRHVVDAGVPVVPWPYLQIGDSVRIERGPLIGIEGSLVQTRGKWRLIMSVELLQRSVGVEIDRGWVRPVSRPKFRHAVA